MTRDEALKVLATWKTNSKNPPASGGTTNYATGFLEGFAEGERKGYEQGVKDSAEIVTGDVLESAEDFEPKIKLKVFDLLDRVQCRILAILDVKEKKA